MVMFEERKRRPNSAELLIEQGKASLQPVIDRLTRDVKTLQSNYQAIQSNYQTVQTNNQTLQTKLQAEQLEKLTIQKHLQKQIEDLKSQLARQKET